MGATNTKIRRVTVICRHFITSHSRQKSSDFITTLLLFKISTSLALLHPHHNAQYNRHSVYVIAIYTYMVYRHSHIRYNKPFYNITLPHINIHLMCSLSISLMMTCLAEQWTYSAVCRSPCCYHLCSFVLCRIWVYGVFVRECVASHPVACHNIWNWRHIITVDISKTLYMDF